MANTAPSNPREGEQTESPNRLLKEYHDEIAKVTSLCASLVHPSRTRVMRGNSVFDSLQIPETSVKTYMMHVLVQTRTLDKLVNACHAMVYIFRYLLVQKERLTLYNAHRLILSALLLTRKQLDDNVTNINAAYSHFGGVSLKECNRLEFEMLHVLCYADFLMVPWESIVKIKEMADGEFQSA